MKPPITSIPTKRWLPAVEWLGENAYIPPGMHRLLAAGGLGLGLWGGRGFMDILTAKRNDDGSAIHRAQVPQMFRPFHGMLEYNPYSDNPSDRWKSVVDSFVPAVLGGVTAYYGSKLFFHGHAPKILDKQQRALHPLSANVRKMLAEGKVSAHAIDHAINGAQAEAIAKGAGVTYIGGATIGTDKSGGFFFGTHNMWASRFAAGASIKPRIPEVPVPVLREGIRWINQKMLGNHSSGSVASGRAMNQAVKWIEGNLLTQGNPATWLHHEGMLARWAKDGLQLYPHATEQQVGAVVASMEKIAHNAYDAMSHLRSNGASEAEITLAVNKCLSGDLKTPGFIHQGFDRMVHEAGVDLGTAQHGNNGLFTMFGRWCGSTKHEAEFSKTYDGYLREHFDTHVKDHVKPQLRQRDIMVVGGGLAASTVGLLGLGGMAGDAMNKRMRLAGGDETAKKQHKNLLDWVNDKPLDVMQWASRIVITPPSMHRLMSAAYLSALLFGGMKVANVLTGHHLPQVRGLRQVVSGTLKTSELARADVKGLLTPLRPLHGILKYTPGSSLPGDRLRQALHYIIPVGFGAVGTWSGSHFYFNDRIKRLKTATSLEDVSDRIAMEQSGAFGGLTAITSVFNTGSGIHLLPFFNYSSNLQSRYVLGDGRQVATPGIGKWWSGNAGLTPWGVKRTLGYMTSYLAHNTDARPTELPSLVHSLVGKLYPNLSETEMLTSKQAMMNHIHEVRDAYLVNGHVPSERAADLKSAMNTLLHTDGLEVLLQQSGLNPGSANLANNGASGKIANALGTKGNVEKLQTTYREKFAQRAEHLKGKTTAEIVAEHSKPIAKTTANDNSTQTHAERLKAQAAIAPSLGA